MNGKTPPSCLYPDQDDCGVPRAFGDWDVAQFEAFVDEFTELSMEVEMDDGTKDTVHLKQLPQDYAGVFQFSFLPKSWVGDAEFCVNSAGGQYLGA